MKISVIIPVFNADKYLEQAVSSVLEAQAVTNSDIEVLIIDDGSTDKSLSVALNIEGKLPEYVRVLRHPGGVNLGAGATRNRGLAEASGEIVTFLDADDWYFPNRFGKCIDMLKNNPSIHAVYSKSQFLYCSENNLGAPKYGDEMFLPYNVTGNSLFQKLLYANSAWSTNSITYRRAFLINEVGFFNDKLSLGQDYEFSLRASLVGNFERDIETSPIAIYRRHPGNRYEGGVSLSWHITCVKVYCSTLRWMKRKGIHGEDLETLKSRVRTSTYERVNNWLARNEQHIARKLMLTFGQEYPEILLEKRFWGNMLKILRFPK